MQHVSSTYRFQNLGLEGADLRARSSKNSMYKFATTPETGEPKLPGYLLDTGDGILQGNWCKDKTHSQDFLLVRCENCLGQLEYPSVTPLWAEFWLLLLVLHQVVLLILDVFSAEM